MTRRFSLDLTSTALDDVSLSSKVERKLNGEDVLSAKCRGKFVCTLSGGTGLIALELWGVSALVDLELSR